MGYYSVHLSLQRKMHICEFSGTKKKKAQALM